MTPRAAVPALLAAALALGLGGCHPKKVSALFSGGLHVSSSDTLKGPVQVVDRLTCPARQDELVLTRAAPDGRSCDYQGRGESVTLSLAQAGDADAALAPFRTQVDALFPGSAHDDWGVDASSVATAQGKTDRIDLPFLHVRDDGRHSHVQVLGVTVDSDHRPGASGGEHDDDGDEQTSVTLGAGRGRESVYVRSGRPAALGGYRSAGYVARGDGRGRAVVALFRTRDATSDGGQKLDGLLALNTRRG